jgi:pyruvate ferredoxin oxidoreductase gamma subunit
MASPFYGAERRGAPVVSFVRIDDRPIRIYSQIEHPDLIIVLDPSIMDSVDILQGLKDTGTVFINSSRHLEISRHLTYQVDLTGIAIAHHLVIAGSPVLNTPMMGAMARMGIVSLEAAIGAIHDMFSDERNIKAAKDAYKELSR